MQRSKRLGQVVIYEKKKCNPWFFLTVPYPNDPEEAGTVSLGSSTRYREARDTTSLGYYSLT